MTPEQIVADKVAYYRYTSVSSERVAADILKALRDAGHLRVKSAGELLNESMTNSTVSPHAFS